MALVMAKLAFITVYCDGSTIGSLSSLRNATRLPFCSFTRWQSVGSKDPLLLVGLVAGHAIAFPFKNFLAKIFGCLLLAHGMGGLDSFFLTSRRMQKKLPTIILSPVVSFEFGIEIF
jgi:hypothetical protein